MSVKDVIKRAFFSDWLYLAIILAMLVSIACAMWEGK